MLVCLCVLAIFTVYIHKLINVKVSFLHEEFSMLIPNAIFDSHSAGWQKTDREVVFCRVRGVDGSCAKHLTVESYMDIYACTQLHLLLLVFHHPLSFIPDLNPAFSAILPTAVFLFLRQD